MTHGKWQTPHWPKDVSTAVPDYNFPLFKFLDDAAAKYPNRDFTVFNGASRTFAQVKDASERVAVFLANNGIKKGDKVAIFLPNLPHFPEILFGILKIGAVAVNCNPIYTASELQYQLRDSESKLVFCMDHPEFYPNACRAIQGTRVETVVACNVKSHLPKLKAVLGSLLGKIPKAPKIEDNHYTYDQVMANSGGPLPQVDIDPENDTAVMLYTGGTTGVPKGAELTHTNFTYDAVAVCEYVRLPHGPGLKPEPMRQGGFHTFLGVLPWYHSFGITTALLSATGTASRLVCIPDPRAGNPPFTEVLKAVQTYKPTIMPAVPTIFVALTNHALLNKFDLSSLMGCFSGGAPLPPEVCHQFEEKTGAIIFEGYGLTETAPVATANPTNREERKIGTIGFPLPGTWVKILDLEDPTQEMQRGEDGEVAICGPQVMKGYWNKPEANDEVFVTHGEDRYFLTGDIGHIDEEGYITITDRKKDMIIVGGFNVYPRDVEDILYTHPQVELTAVVGVPDDKSGEKVKAFIKLKQGEDASEEEIRRFCKENMAGYKQPKFIEFREDIPVSNVGKVLRRVLRDEERSNA
ncbi:MAG: long-chain fatty acid--CoA ligase [Desulfobacterales bacterium]|nr:long-chain fatty acid--CoA ligase [Desulfobacterales bacterium]